MQFSNVWDALFDDPGEKAVLEIKSGLMDEVRQHLESEESVELDFPLIGEIKAGMISKFAIEELQEILNEIQRIYRNIRVQH
jgi:predicted XRE-type DNA-binding protein